MAVPCMQSSVCVRSVRCHRTRSEEKQERRVNDLGGRVGRDEAQTCGWIAAPAEDGDVKNTGRPRQASDVLPNQRSFRPGWGGFMIALCRSSPHLVSGLESPMGPPHSEMKCTATGAWHIGEIGRREQWGLWNVPAAHAWCERSVGLGIGDHARSPFRGCAGRRHDDQVDGTGNHSSIHQHQHDTDTSIAPIIHTSPKVAEL